MRVTEEEFVELVRHIPDWDPRYHEVLIPVSEEASMNIQNTLAKLGAVSDGFRGWADKVLHIAHNKHALVVRKGMRGDTRVDWIENSSTLNTLTRSSMYTYHISLVSDVRDDAIATNNIRHSEEL